MNKKELELQLRELKHQVESLNHSVDFLNDKTTSLDETLASVNNRLYHATHTHTLREFMKLVEKEHNVIKISFVVDFEKHRYSAENCKDFEKYYGKKLLDNTIVVECKQVINYSNTEYVIDVETKGGNNE